MRRRKASSPSAESVGSANPAAAAASSGDRVDARQQFQVLLQHAIALTVGRAREVDQARQPVHHQRVRVVAEAIGVGHGEPVRLQEVVHRDFVGDARRHRDARFALASRVQWQQTTVDLDVDVPRRAPPRHAIDPRHASAHCALDPGREPRAFGCRWLRPWRVAWTENI